MRADERLTVATPEDIDISLTLAGIGSRFTAAFIDLLVQVVIIYITLTVAVFAISPAAGSEIGFAVFVAVTLVIVFVVFFLYHLVLEAFWRGKTLGKAALGLYVVRDGGMPLTPGPAAIRNLLRIVDFLPVFYVVGFVSILATHRRKRLGDFVAATLVVKKAGPEPGTGAIRLTEMLVPNLATWDVTAVSDDEELLVRRFLARRAELSASRRVELGAALDDHIRPKVIGAIGNLAPEAFLEAVALRTSWRSAPGAYQWYQPPPYPAYPQPPPAASPNRYGPDSV